MSLLVSYLPPPLVDRICLPELTNQRLQAQQPSACSDGFMLNRLAQACRQHPLVYGICGLDRFDPMTWDRRRAAQRSGDRSQNRCYRVGIPAKVGGTDDAAGKVAP